MRVEPIRPDEVCPRALPDDVIEVFNHLIQSNFRNGSAVFTQELAVSLLIGAGYMRNQIFDNRLLDVEDAYRCAG